jgi:hypothetical protein
MKRSTLTAGTLIALLALTLCALAPRAEAASCTNIYTGDVYTCVSQAVNGFIAHANLIGGAGFLTGTVVNCLVAAALSAEAHGSVSQFNALMFQLLQLNTPGQFLSLLGPPFIADATRLPQEGGPFLSVCFFNLLCPSPPGGAGNTSDACEADRRLFARVLAADIFCASQLQSAGATSCP